MLLDADPNLAVKKDEKGVPPIQPPDRRVTARSSICCSRAGGHQREGRRLAVVGAESRRDLWSNGCREFPDRTRGGDRHLLRLLSGEAGSREGTPRGRSRTGARARPDGATPLHFAVGWHVEKLRRSRGLSQRQSPRFSIERGADVNAKDLWHGGSVLKWAGIDRPMAQFVLKHRPTLDIFEASEMGDIQRVRATVGSRSVARATPARPRATSWAGRIRRFIGRVGRISAKRPRCSWIAARTLKRSTEITGPRRSSTRLACERGHRRVSSSIAGQRSRRPTNTERRRSRSPA